MKEKEQKIKKEMKEVERLGKCLKCGKPMVKNHQSCVRCRKKMRLKSKVNSRGKNKKYII